MKYNKVVYNDSYGGFNLSSIALTALKQLGVEDENFYTLSRHDPRLVEVIEKLGEFANANYSRLKVWYLKGDKYIIHEYDGKEEVVEPDDIMWIKVE